MTIKEMLSLCVTALDKKLANDIRVLKIEEITTLADYFVICTGSSNTHLRTLKEAVEEAFDKAGIAPHHIEGHGGAWVLMDYGSVVVHIFTDEGRSFYQLDKVWADAKDIPAAELIKA